MSANSIYAVVVLIVLSLWLAAGFGLSRCSAFHEDMGTVSARAGK